MSFVGAVGLGVVVDVLSVDVVSWAGSGEF